MMRLRHKSRPPARQRGAALLVAMLTVTLVAALAASALWRQWRSVEVEAAERERMQAAWMLTGALDWARLILREDARSGNVDHLSEPWAVPLQEARLSDFLAAGQGAATGTEGVGEDMLGAFLSGRITDLQSRMNLLNLVNGGKVSDTALADFTRLFNLLGLPIGQLQALAANLVAAAGTAPDAPLSPQRLAQLLGLGLTPATLAALAPYVTLLPVRTTINLNTASAEVLSASVPGLDLADAQRLVESRARAYFRSTADASAVLGGASSLFTADRHTVSSSFFEVRSRLRLGDLTLEERAVLQRNGLAVVALSRERVTP